MKDNPRKKKQDAKRVSQQPHEQAYQKRKKSQSAENSSRERNDDRTSTSGPSNSRGER